MSDNQESAFNKYLDGENVFITGQGGTGKSYFIKKIYEDSIKKGKNINVTALTGCAALLLDCKATTIHYWSGIGMGNLNESFFSGLTSVGRNLGIMDTLGTKPEMNFEKIRKAVSLRLNQSGRDAGAVAEKKFYKFLDVVTGRIYETGSFTGAKWGAITRAIASMAKLGGAVVSAAADLAQYGGEMRYQGRSFFGGMGEAMGSLAKIKNKKEIHQFFSNIYSRSIILDRDGVINVNKGYVGFKKDFVFQPGAIKAIKYLNRNSIDIFVVSNQSGIARGYFKVKNVEYLHNHLRDTLIKNSAVINKIYYSPYHKDGIIKKYKKNSNCRKPGIKLFENLIKEWDISDKSQIIMIGDQITDMQFADKAKIKSALFLGGNLYNFVKKLNLTLKKNATFDVIKCNLVRLQTSSFLVLSNFF